MGHDAPTLHALLTEFGLTLDSGGSVEPAALLDQLRRSGARRVRGPEQEPLFEAVYAMSGGDFSRPVRAPAPHAALGQALDQLRQRLEEDFVHTEQFSALLEAMPLQIIVAHPTGEIWDANALAVEGWGRSLQGRLQDLLDVAVLLSDMPPLERRQREQTLMLSIGEVCLDDGQQIGWVCIGVDVTMRATARSELQRARNLAEAALRARTAFLTNISHEIRTPLYGILGAAEALEQEQALSAEAKPLVSAIQSSGRVLTGLIEDVLDLMQLETGQLSIRRRPTPIRPLFAELLSPHRDAARLKRLELQVELSASLPTRIVLDSSRLRKIIAHLLDNAVKFTDVGALMLRASYRSGTLTVSVEDTGIGILDSRHERIFEAFVQGESTHQHRGLGRGLALSRQLAERMGGSLSVTPREPAGSCFTLTLPCADASAAPKPSGTPLQGQRILVVDDHPINLLIAERLLRAQGATVLLAASGAEGLALLQEGDISLVLMDCQMPDLDGYETTRRYRDWEATADRPRVPIIALTASATGNEALRCAEAGMDALLEKPLDVVALRDDLSQLLSRR
ncbi:MAG: signal transduction histidine kinase/ActR/RegA family two-component response regulator [Myxococcota bacterium]|jgi:signal transduction histidine kinase/ActR/RegA family two-component response regulator